MQRVFPVRAQPVPRVGAWVVTGAEVGAHPGASLRLSPYQAIWLGSGLRQSNVMNSFSCEEFIISVYSIILKLDVFI